MDTETKQKVVAENKRHEKDTGSPEVQVALLTARINEMTEHLRSHKKDFAGREGLLRLVGQRSSLLKYLQREDLVRYNALITKLGIRK